MSKKPTFLEQALAENQKQLEAMPPDTQLVLVAKGDTRTKQVQFGLAARTGNGWAIASDLGYSKEAGAYLTGSAVWEVGKK